MAELSIVEKTKLEKFLRMPTGYVIDFSDRTFQEFIADTVGLDIFDQKYNYASCSKANRLRSFFKQEPDYMVGKLLRGLLDYWQAKVQAGEITEFDYPGEWSLYPECEKICERLLRCGIVQDIDAIRATTDDRDFVALEKAVHDSIRNNEPEHALDRLHTFLLRYIREHCQKHNISITSSESLNAIYGKYVTHLAKNNLIESVMTEKILRYATNLLDAFNDIRNNRSLAHSNQLLNYDESLLIVNSIANIIKFIQKIEGNLSNKPVADSKDIADSLPF